MSINTYIATQVNLCNLEIALTRTSSVYTKVEISKGYTSEGYRQRLCILAFRLKQCA